MWQQQPLQLQQGGAAARVHGTRPQFLGLQRGGGGRYYSCRRLLSRDRGDDGASGLRTNKCARTLSCCRCCDAPASTNSALAL